jgi:hypothetical protein
VSRSAAALLAGAVLCTLLLFVLPVGFVYVRFLLVPLAVLCVGAGLVAAAALAGSRGAAAALGAGLLVALAFDRDLRDYHRHVVPQPDARVLAEAELARRRADGATVALVADAREHGPPLDPARGPVLVLGLDEAEAALAAWAALPLEQRPELVLWMAFPSDPPSGRAEPLPSAPAVGTRVGGIYEVLAAWDAGPLSAPVRSLTVRPLVTLLGRRAP